MAAVTNVSWCDSTFNGWIGCDKVSPGCDFCYAEVSTPSRTMKIHWGPKEPRSRTSDGNWAHPRRWESTHEAFFAEHGRRRRVFCASLSDVFDRHVDAQWRADLWRLIRETPHLDWLVLTKRVGNVPSMLPEDWGSGYPNVWLGITVVNQEEVLRDIPKLMRVPAQLRWLSLEPLIAEVDILRVPTSSAERLPGWWVVGGGSGRDKRVMEPRWVRSIQRQAKKARAVFYFKQWGGSGPEKGGCRLNGKEYKAWPRSPYECAPRAGLSVSKASKGHVLRDEARA